MVREIELKPGLALHIIDTRVEKSLTVHHERCGTSPVIFGFFFSGNGKTVVNNDAGKQMPFTGEQGKCGISYFPHSSCVSELPSQKRLQLVHILIDHFLLDALLTGGQEKIAPGFHPVLNQKSNHFYQTTTISYPMQMAVAQLLNCPFQGPTQRIYLESKAMELIALQLEALVFSSPGHSAQKKPDRSETDRIYEAREIILDRYLNPPSLGELSRLVGINEFKLKKGFQKVFGNTVFGCLFDHRMEHARQHIEGGNKSVKEIAHAVGYQSTSRFSDAFKRKFGTRPTHYLS